MSAAALWGVVLASGAGCFLLKFAGYAMPQRWFAHEHMRKAVAIMPVALLAALVVVQSIAAGRHYDVDSARLAGVAVGAFAVWRRASFLVVIVAAAATAGLLRQI